jgi:hypothetical protein
MSVSSLINHILEAIKWPVAAFCLIILPFSVVALSDSKIIGEVFSNNGAIVAGFSIYLVVWFFYFSRPSAGSFFSTFEHELTHAIFAWATFKKVTGLKATWREGGVCSWEGGKNWLIFIAPYFFPTLMLVPIVLSFVVKREYFEAVEIMLGAVMAYHMTSTYLETHSNQTDLQETSFLFAFLFLPTANIMVYTTALIYFVRGPKEASDYVVECCSRAWDWLLLLT